MKKVEIVSVGPKEAQVLLDNMMDNQRNIRTNKVHEYARDMQDGKFCLSNDALVVVNGKTANGNHRLNAVIKSGVAVEFIIFHTDNHNIIRIMDGGTPRKVSDVIKMEGYDYCNTVAGMVSWILAYKRGLLTPSNNLGHHCGTVAIKKLISRQDRIQFAVRHMNALRQAAAFCAVQNDKYGMIGASISGSIYFLIAEKHSCDLAVKFIESTYTGEPSNGAIKLFRTSIIKDASARSRIPRPTVFAMYIKTFNSWFNGTVPGHLKVARNESFPVLV